MEHNIPELVAQLTLEEKAGLPVQKFMSGSLGGDAPLVGAAENIVKSAYVEFE